MIVSGRGQRPVDGEGAAGRRSGPVAVPVRSGAVPSLSDGFSARAEAAADLGAALAAGAAVVLSAYVEAAVTAMGADPGGDGESVAARFARWLSQTSRPWLVVLDDLRDVADLDGLWPAGPAGRLLITTANPAAFFAEQGALTHPVGVFSPQEALSYLMNRLTADSGKQQGAADLAQDLGYEPLALEQASAVITSSELSCADYGDDFASRREQVAEAAGGSPPAAASITWAISVEHANRLLPGGA